MSVKGSIFIFGFLVCAVGALFVPSLGVYGYIADYCIAPSDQWWGRPFAQMGIRFSLMLALTTLIGILLQRKKLEFGKKYYIIRRFVFFSFYW